MTETSLFVYDPTAPPAFDRQWVSLRQERALLAVVIVSLASWLVMAWGEMGKGWL